MSHTSRHCVTVTLACLHVSGHQQPFPSHKACISSALLSIVTHILRAAAAMDGHARHLQTCMMISCLVLLMLTSYRKRTRTNSSPRVHQQQVPCRIQFTPPKTPPGGPHGMMHALTSCHARHTCKQQLVSNPTPHQHPPPPPDTTLVSAAHALAARQNFQHCTPYKEKDTRHASGSLIEHADHNAPGVLERKERHGASAAAHSVPDLHGACSAYK